jgi:hypothetical protein
MVPGAKVVDKANGPELAGIFVKAPGQNLNEGAEVAVNRERVGIPALLF